MEHKGLLQLDMNLRVMICMGLRYPMSTVLHAKLWQLLIYNTTSTGKCEAIEDAILGSNIKVLMDTDGNALEGTMAVKLY